MSEGPFEDAIYEMENGMFASVSVQPETILAAVGGDGNDEAAGPLTVGIPSAKISLTDGEIGLRPRYFTGKWTTVPADSDYAVGGRVKLSILSVASKAVFVKGADVSYLGGTVRVSKQFPELVN